MTILTGNPMPQLMAVFRKLKAQKDAIDQQMSKVKADIVPIVEAEGKYKDDDGYAQMVTRKASVSYSNSAVEDLAQAWRISDDPIMKSCGQMLWRCREEKPGSTYLQVK